MMGRRTGSNGSRNNNSIKVTAVVGNYDDKFHIDISAKENIDHGKSFLLSFRLESEQSKEEDEERLSELSSSNHKHDSKYFY